MIEKFLKKVFFLLVNLILFISFLLAQQPAVLVSVFLEFIDTFPTVCCLFFPHVLPRELQFGKQNSYFKFECLIMF